MRSDKLKPILGYEGLYSITSNGRVFRHARRAGHNTSAGQRLKAKWLKTGHNKYNGYGGIRLYDGTGDWSGKYIHHLVMLTFGPPKPTKHHEINHKDGIKTNNKISNLEWTTHKENVRHAISIGNGPKNCESFGMYNGNSKLTNNDIIAIRKRFAENTISMRALGKEYNVSGQTISIIVQRLIWKHIP